MKLHSNGELYTILTNKAGKGKKGTIVAMIAGTKADTVTAIIEKILSRIKSQRLPRHGCKYGINTKMFSKCYAVTDRFTNFIKLLNSDTASQIQFKTSLEALQEIRIKYRWQAIDQENEAMEKLKKGKV
jgi:hypothetical protein